MKWLNPPQDYQCSDGNISLITSRDTDFWRHTHYHMVKHSGHFFFEKVKGDFEISVRFKGQYKHQYDQAGIMLRLDEENWLKCGIEYYDDVYHLSVVVTRGYSDWSVSHLSSPPESLKLRVIRRSDSVEILSSLDGVKFELIRLCFLTEEEVIEAGIMAASPMGEGFEVFFEDLIIKPLI